MASIIGSILSSLNAKSTVLFTNELTNTECWTDANVSDVEIISGSENSRNPLSNQNVTESSVSEVFVSDDLKTAKILRPVRIRVTILTDNISLIQNIMSLYQDTSTTLKIVSKSIVSESMSISDVLIEQSPEMISAAKITIILEQTKPQENASNFVPENTSNNSNVGLGVQNLTEVGPSLGVPSGGSIGSLVAQASTAVGGLYQRFIHNIGL